MLGLIKKEKINEGGKAGGISDKLYSFFMQDEDDD